MRRRRRASSTRPVVRRFVQDADEIVDSAARRARVGRTDTRPSSPAARARSSTGGRSTRSARSSRSRSTSSATSSCTATSRATSSKRPGSTRASTPIRRGASSTRSSGPRVGRTAARPARRRAGRHQAPEHAVAHLRPRAPERMGLQTGLLRLSTSYTKPELLLRTLEHHLGATTMARVMRTYHERWRFRHLSSDDFYAVANEMAGRDLSWFFKPIVEGTGVIDYEIASATSEREARRAACAARTARGRWRRPATATGPPRRGGRGCSCAGWARSPFRRRPTHVGGRLDRTGRMGRAAPGHASSACDARACGMLDPENRITLEMNRINNGRRLRADARLATSWTTRWIFWVQNILAGAGL